MISIDKYAYASKLKNIDPMLKVVFSMLTLSVCIWANNLVISAAVILMMGGITVFKGYTPFLFFLKLLFVPMSFLLVGVLSIAVNIAESHGALLAAIPIAGTWIGFSHAGMQDAIRLFLKALGAVSCLYFLSLSTPMVDILAALRRLRVPKLIVELMGLIYRFIFILFETADIIYNAQNCRLGYSNLSTGYRSLGSLVSMLFVMSYKQSDELYTALEARGYEGELNVLEQSYERCTRGYILAIAINILLVISAVALQQVKGGIL